MSLCGKTHYGRFQRDSFRPLNHFSEKGARDEEQKAARINVISGRDVGLLPDSLVSLRFKACTSASLDGQTALGTRLR